MAEEVLCFEHIARLLPFFFFFSKEKDITFQYTLISFSKLFARRINEKWMDSVIHVRTLCKRKQFHLKNFDWFVSSWFLWSSKLQFLAAVVALRKKRNKLGRERALVTLFNFWSGCKELKWSEDSIITQKHRWIGWWNILAVASSKQTKWIYWN